MSGDLSNEALKAIDLARKLLALSKGNTTEAEAASAASKAMELLATHNLDISIIERSGGTKEARGKEGRSGGLYKWQRTLWRAIAELNFCLYETVKGTNKGDTFKHELIGRKVNIASCYHLGDYLEQTIDRLTKEWLGGDMKQFFTRSANSYKEGIADTIVMKLQDRRREWLREQKAKEEAARQANPNAGNALTVTAMSEAEYDANMDIKYGEGYSARLRAAQAASAARWEEAKLLRKKWEIDNPEAFAAEQEQIRLQDERYRKEYEKKERRRARSGGGYTYRAPSYKGDINAYYRGQEAGRSVNLDKQVDKKTTGMLK